MNTPTRIDFAAIRAASDARESARKAWEELAALHVPELLLKKGPFAPCNYRVADSVLAPALDAWTSTSKPLWDLKMGASRLVEQFWHRAENIEVEGHQVSFSDTSEEDFIVISPAETGYIVRSTAHKKSAVGADMKALKEAAKAWYVTPDWSAVQKFFVKLRTVDGWFHHTSSFGGIAAYAATDGSGRYVVASFETPESTHCTITAYRRKEEIRRWNLVDGTTLAEQLVVVVKAF